MDILILSNLYVNIILINKNFKVKQKEQVAVTTCSYFYKKDSINLKMYWNNCFDFFSNIIVVFLCF